MSVIAETSAELAVDQRTPWGQHALLYVVCFLVGAELYLVSPLLPEIAESLGTSIASVATMVTAFAVVYALAAPPLGSLSDRWPRKRSAIAGSIVIMIGNIRCAIAPGLGGLIVARSVTGLGAALAGPAIWACLAERSAGPQRGRAISLGASAVSLGQVTRSSARGRSCRRRRVARTFSRCGHAHVGSDDHPGRPTRIHPRRGRVELISWSRQPANASTDTMRARTRHTVPCRFGVVLAVRPPAYPGDG